MIKVIDISKHNGVMDWQRTKDSDADAVIIRATCTWFLGYIEDDPQLHNNVIGAESIGMPYGFYTYFIPTFNVGNQISRFLSKIKPYNPSLPNMLDVEHISAPISAGDCSSRILQALNLITADSKRLPMIYTSAEWWNNHTIALSSWKNYDLVIARYNSVISGPWSDGKFKIRDWDTWRLWQYSANGNNLGDFYGGQGDDMDLSRFNGTEEQFNTWVGSSILPIEPGLKFSVISSTLNIRSGPGTSYSIVGQLAQGEQVVAQNVSGTDSWIEIYPNQWCCVKLGSTSYLKKV